MTSKEALENIKIAVEYLTRLDYVDPIVRGEVKQILFDAYHKTTPEFKIIEKDLEVLEIIKENHFEIDKDGNIYVGNIGDVLLGIEDYYEDMEEEYNKIKEWLENDK